MSERAKKDAVLIQLRNLEGPDLKEEEESGDKEFKDEERPTVKELLISRDKKRRCWDTFFLVICAFAVFIDPLFCYIEFFDLSFDLRQRRQTALSSLTRTDFEVLWGYAGLRLVIDAFYITDIFICFRGKICKKCKGKKFGTCCWKPKPDHQQEQESVVTSLKQEIQIQIPKLFLLPIIPAHILVALPIPEVLILVSVAYSMSSSSYSSSWIFDPSISIFLIVPFQYILRIFLIYGSKRWRPTKETRAGRWLKPLLDFLPFILASHLFGALWYRLAIQRFKHCWSTDNHTKECPIYNENKTAFDFGIYQYALQSGTVTSFSLPRRIMQSFWWALRNLSSFGSNLQTSTNPLEVFFSIVISISGMALFLVYLNARVKESQEKSNQLKLKGKKHVLRPDIDLWISKNVSTLRTTINKSNDSKPGNPKKKALKTVILENIHKLEENKTIDVQNIIYILPTKYKRSIKRLLCLALLKKVPMLASLNEKMLKVICEHLKPVIYIEDSCIVNEGRPLGMVLFIIQGVACTYTTANNDGASTSCGSSSNMWLKRGDFLGEDLVRWALKCPFSDLPISTKTVMSQEKVEAFTLRASDLKNIVSMYWSQFTRKLPPIELKQWENTAASTIQAAWRSRRVKAKRASGWDKCTV